MSLERKTQEYVLTETKMDVVKPNIVIGKGVIDYTGDSSVNKAIAHGLGFVPVFGFIVCDEDTQAMFILSGGKLYFSTSRVGVTAMDATNVYVGDASSYGLSANYTGYHYHLVVLG